jgi:hypothetical protein
MKHTTKIMLFAFALVTVLSSCSKTTVTVTVQPVEYNLEHYQEFNQVDTIESKWNH